MPVAEIARPVVRENVRSGAISRYVHDYRPALRGTLCGLSERTDNPAVQLSVEPEGTTVTCPRCLALASETGRVV